MPLEIYKSLDELLAIDPPEDEEMFPLEWDPHVLDLPLYQRDNGDLIGGIVSQRQELRQHRAMSKWSTTVLSSEPRSRLHALLRTKREDLAFCAASRMTISRARLGLSVNFNQVSNQATF